MTPKRSKVGRELTILLVVVIAATCFPALVVAKKFPPYQWAQILAATLEFRPNLIIELSHRAGNSTACFLQAADEIGPECKLLSLCLDSTWKTATLPKLRLLMPSGWFDAGEILQEDKIGRASCRERV